MKVLFLAMYSDLAASSRTRVYDFLPYLKREGLACKVICFTPKYFHAKNKFFDYVLLAIVRLEKIFEALFFAGKYDVIFIQKITFSFGLEKILKIINKKIIFDYDDAIFTSEKKNNKNVLRKRWFENILNVSECVIVENDYNREVAQRFCARVEIITGPIDTEKYFIKKNTASDKVIVGWTGSHSTTKYLLPLKKTFHDLKKKFSNVEFEFIGADENVFKSEAGFKILKWSLENEVSLIQNFDIGIMPLPDNEWTRGKGGYKLLQYMACGIPCVASPVGINSKIISDGEVGFLADHDDEWFSKLSMLISDPELRSKLGDNGRKKMERDYSLNEAAGKLVNILNSL